ncbi:hypothetical protein RUM43_007355 [Polyplax serrata]|uniref:Arginyl-tRNA--protein transferase 1 n=1 Tax=Polyplax serrata TaxID=468196 RepID=A0AAN8P5K0_POLSC
MDDYHPSIVEYYSEQRKGHCGYCSSEEGSCTYGLHAHILNVDDYQNMIDRGWRRCGQYCYKSIMDITCCPLYTIRCAVNDFRLSKTQKKILKKVNQFLATGSLLKDNASKNLDHVGFQHLTNIKSVADSLQTTVSSSLITPSQDMELSNINSSQVKKEPIYKKSEAVNTNVSTNERPIKTKTQKAKYLRIQRKRLKLQNLGLNEEEISRKLIEKKKYPVVKTIEDFLKNDSTKGQAHNLKISLVRSSPRSKEFDNTYPLVFDLYKRYQISIHRDAPEKITERQFERFLVVSPLKIRLVSVSSSEFKETYNEVLSLFKKYQMAIHHESEEDCDASTFNDFLIHSPFEASNTYGSYHQQYWLDNKLIAVGVVDILPKCVSSVYFFYDPDYSHLSLGVYGALRWTEIEFTRRLSSQLPDLNYYYMGFYIHSCVKMKYKAAYKPSFLLCPEVYTWHPILDCIPKLNLKKYTRFNEDLTAVDSNSKASPSDVLILYNRVAMPLVYYLKQKKCSSEEVAEIMEYANLVGVLCSKKLLLFRM